MGSRPRCRDWTPLATQQLRLRNLIQISGHNIVTSNSKAVVFYTLHPTTMSSPFFTSESLPTPQNAIWPEINCPSILKSNALSVCIRVWRAKGPEESSDELIFLWGVYFSGLVPISKRTDVKLRENSLVFHIHGGFFTSSECLLTQSIPQQLEFFGFTENSRRREHLIMPFPHTPDICDTLPVLSRHIGQNHEAKSKQKKSPICSTTETATTLKMRYIEKQFYVNEIRASYNVEKLLLLQRKQRQLKKQAADAKDIRDDICMRSAFCLDLDLIANKSMNNHRPRASASMGLTLTRLLAKQSNTSLNPELLLSAQELRKQIESARFLSTILLHERDETRLRLRRLEQQLTELGDANIEKESWLLANYHELRREKEAAKEDAESIRKKTGHLRWLKAELVVRRHQLLRELKEIYCIKKMKRGMYKINNAVLSNTPPFLDLCSASHISVSLGYAAHLTTMICIILDEPLRNEILLKGSASRIRDDIKPTDDIDREYPLYCRSIPPPNPQRYGVYLLNQNICQLCYSTGAPTDDKNENTLFNLLSLITHEPSNGSSVSSCNLFANNQPPALISESTDKLSTSGLVTPSLVIKNPLLSDIQTGSSTDQRICRSVGSYSDDTLEDPRNRTQFGSAPNLAHTTTALTVFADNGNI